VAEFKKAAPKVGALDDHGLMLKRLGAELAERKKLCEREKELQVTPGYTRTP